MASENSSKPKLPTKWLVAIIACLIVYAFVQPAINKRFGLKLPSVASLLGQEENQDKVDSEVVTSRDTGSENSTLESDASDQATESERPSSPDSTSSAGAKPNDRKQADPANRSGQGRGPPAETQSPSDGDLKFGLLHEIGDERFQSPAGLLYLPMGGSERHRLVHIGKHLEDSPSRPAHGVFDGDMPQVLRWLDEAYGLIKDGDKRAYQKESGNRDVYDVRFKNTVGYLGGRAGKRKNNPDAYKIRLVLEGNRVITAFPVD